MKNLIKTILVIVILLVNSCGEGITEPEPGRRDYVWEVDEINPGYESLSLGRIWGSSPNDVWAVGSSSWSATSIWHYDGIKWETDSIPRAVDPNAIWGLSKNEVWLGNYDYNNNIWRYNGSKWSLFGSYILDGYDILCINYFDGTSSNNIYGVGFVELYGKSKWKAIIMHYNGTNWRFVDIPESKASFESVAIVPGSDVLVMSGTIYDPKGFIAKVYCWDGKELKEIFSSLGGWTFVVRLGNEIFISHSSQIYKYSDKRLTLWMDNRGKGINGNIICGRSRNDFFIGGDEGIYHYNGKEFYNIYNTELVVRRGYIFERDVFFIGLDYVNGKNYIIHGKLK
jgi:hypothetical protein